MQPTASFRRASTISPRFQRHVNLPLNWPAKSTARMRLPVGRVLHRLKAQKAFKNLLTAGNQNEEPFWRLIDGPLAFLWSTCGTRRPVTCNA